MLLKEFPQLKNNKKTPQNAPVVLWGSSTAAPILLFLLKGGTGSVPLGLRSSPCFAPEMYPNAS